MGRSDVVLRWAAAVELATLALLLGNRATTQVETVASLVGPLHGTAYLVVIVSALRLAGLSRGERALAWVPGVGGMLVLWRLRRSAARGTTQGVVDVAGADVAAADAAADREPRDRGTTPG